MSDESVEILHRLALELEAASYHASFEYPGYVEVKLPEGARIAMGFEDPAPYTELLCTVYDADDHASDGVIEPLPRGTDILHHAIKVCDEHHALKRTSTVRIVAYVDGVQVGEESCDVPSHLAPDVASFALVQGDDPDLDLAWERWNYGRERTAK